MLASGSDADSARPEFATISELTAERIRRAADASAPGLTFTEVAVADPPAAEA
ncbi:hypothetical protein IOD13_18620 [Brevibacterium casei]|nr:hypothetical protein [Brevibacterium casei]